MKKIYLIISIIILAGLAFSIGGEGDSDEPEILSVSALPQKVKVGDILTITAEIKDKNGIEKVSAIMPYENNRADEIQLSLISGDNKSGKWQGEWKCHNTINIEYITTITAINILGKSAMAEVSWWDDTETVWLSGWNHRKKITFDNATASANYQVKVILTTSNFDYNKVITGGDDIRFTEADGTNLDYWIETWNTSGDSTLWVEVATISTSTIYMYYGNPSASSASDGDTTFEFFDDFEDSTLDTNKWNSGGTPTISSGELLINAYGEYIRSINTFQYKAMKTRVKFPATSISYHYFGFQSNADGGSFNTETFGSYATPDLKTISGDTDTVEMTSIYNSAYFGSYHNYEILWKSGEAKFYVDETLKDTDTTDVCTIANPVGFYDYSGAGDLYVDWTFVRNYSIPEPTATVAADEERKPGAPGVNPSGGGGMMF